MFCQDKCELLSKWTSTFVNDSITRKVYIYHTEYSMLESTVFLKGLSFSMFRFKYSYSWPIDLGSIRNSHCSLYPIFSFKRVSHSVVITLFTSHKLYENFHLLDALHDFRIGKDASLWLYDWQWRHIVTSVLRWGSLYKCRWCICTRVEGLPSKMEGRGQQL